MNNLVIGELAISGNSIFAGTWGGGVFRSTNNGINWTAVNNGLTELHVLELVVSGTNLFAGTEGGVFLSSNNGEIWINKNQGFSSVPPVNSLLITNGYIFAGTEGQSVWRRPLSDITGIQSNSTEIPSAFSLSQNYPNPFNPRTKIRFDIKKPEVRSQKSEVTLKIYDVLGREVETLVSEQLAPGTYEATFDGSMHNSGVYFYKLQTENFTETKLMVYLK